MRIYGIIACKGKTDSLNLNFKPEYSQSDLTSLRVISLHGSLKEVRKNIIEIKKRLISNLSIDEYKNFSTPINCALWVTYYNLSKKIKSDIFNISDDLKCNMNYNTFLKHLNKFSDQEILNSIIYLVNNNENRYITYLLNLYKIKNIYIKWFAFQADTRRDRARPPRGAKLRRAHRRPAAGCAKAPSLPLPAPVPLVTLP
jgi:hypothetical protein